MKDLQKNLSTEAKDALLSIFLNILEYSTEDNEFIKTDIHEAGTKLVMDNKTVFEEAGIFETVVKVRQEINYTSALPVKDFLFADPVALNQFVEQKDTRYVVYESEKLEKYVQDHVYHPIMDAIENGALPNHTYQAVSNALADLSNIAELTEQVGLLTGKLPSPEPGSVELWIDDNKHFLHNLRPFSFVTSPLNLLRVLNLGGELYEEAEIESRIRMVRAKREEKLNYDMSELRENARKTNKFTAFMDVPELSEEV